MLWHRELMEFNSFKWRKWDFDSETHLGKILDSMEKVPNRSHIILLWAFSLKSS